MYSSIVWTITSAVSLVLMISILVMQLMEMKTYELLFFK